MSAAADGMKGGLDYFENAHPLRRRGMLTGGIQFRQHQQIRCNVIQAHRMRENDLDKLPVVSLVFQGSIQQRLGIAAYGGKWSPQFMRDVCHEVFARLLLALD